MRSLTVIFALTLALFLTACTSTPAERIADNPALFDTLPPPVRQKIRAGEVDVGFTPEMVRLALGDPTRVFSRQTAAGVAELWVYHDHGPRFSFGVGVGSFGRHSGTSVDMATSTGGYDPEEKMRVEFRDGHVTAVEYVNR